MVTHPYEKLKKFSRLNCFKVHIMKFYTAFLISFNVCQVFSALRGTNVTIVNNTVVDMVSYAHNCSSSYQCSYNGFCTNDKFCHCNAGYITYPSGNTFGCNYKQKSTITAFCLQFFLGYISGAGYLYLGKIPLGIGELFLFWGGLIFICIAGGCLVVYCKKPDNKKTPDDDGTTEIVTKITTNCLMLGCFIWWIYALVVIGTGNILDGNGAPINSL